MSARAPSAALLPRRMARATIVFAGSLPWLVTLARAWRPQALFAALLSAPFGFICHQRPERTLDLLGSPMPVCSRCAGLFLGGALGGLVPWPRLELAAARLGVAATAAFMALDVMLQDLGVHPVWHATRLLTGLALGFVAARALDSRLADEASSRTAPGEVSPSP